MFYVIAFIIAILIFFILKKILSNKKKRNFLFKILFITILLVLTFILVFRFGYAFLSFSLPVLYYIFRNSIAKIIANFFHFNVAKSSNNSQNFDNENDFSEVNTETLVMRLYHDSGKIDGSVKKGNYINKKLSELKEQQLINLMMFCIKNDEESASLLEAYLDRMTDFNWREKINLTNSENQKQSQNSGTMSKNEAYEILGLRPGSGKEEIKEAYHRLMVKFHPDRGGTDFLASKINQAKDLLLKDF